MGLVGLIAGHGYLVVGLVLFVAALGLPLPVSIALLAGGAAAHHGLRFGVLLPVAFGSAMLGDTVLFFGGRYTGWWLLAGLCRLSMNPEGCIFGSAEYFYRRGAWTLLFAKFVPGLGAMAAPLAGSLNMRFWRFFRLAAAGNLIYCSAWLGMGWVFSGFIRQIAAVVESAGHYVLIAGVVLVVGYGLALVGFTVRAQRYQQIEKISAAGLYERLQERNPGVVVVIADVRSHGYYDSGMQRIKNSIRVEPHRLKEELESLRAFMAPDCEVYLYCSCIRETTSVRVAHMLQQENCKTRVIQGGLKAWVKAGGDVEMVPEGDVQRLPRFE